MTAINPQEHPTAAGEAAEPPAIEIDAPQLHPAAEEPIADLPLSARIEALLISSDRPLTDARLGALLALAGRGVAGRVREAVEQLNADYEQTGRAFRIERLAGGWQVLTRPQFSPLLARLHQDRQQSRLSQAALESLAIIAYRQPIIRAEIEAIRGVSCGEVLRGLLERRLVKIVGRAEELGRPMLYGTTRQFLNVFGLSGLDDLPRIEGLETGKAPADEAGHEAGDEAAPAGEEVPSERPEAESADQSSDSASAEDRSPQ